MTPEERQRVEKEIQQERIQELRRLHKEREDHHKRMERQQRRATHEPLESAAFWLEVLVRKQAAVGK